MTKLITTTNELKKFTNSLPHKDIGLVATMGNLHEGHLSLINESVSNNKLTIVTIFVNPKQFGPNEDFDKYPRTLSDDISKIEEMFSSHEIVVFAPSSNNEIYPVGFDTKISVGKISTILCGQNRPGHFDGVTTVVYKLLKLTCAKNAYFGQKDFQQVKVIQAMVNDLTLDISIVMIPISRDQDLLAKSSRNQFLSDDDRSIALTLTKTILELATELKENSWLNSQIKLNNILEKSLKDPKWDYLEILDADNLIEVSPATTKVVILGAFKVNSTRLIDNRIVEIAYA